MTGAQFQLHRSWQHHVRQYHNQSRHQKDLPRQFGNVCLQRCVTVGVTFHEGVPKIAQSDAKTRDEHTHHHQKNAFVAAARLTGHTFQWLYRGVIQSHKFIADKDRSRGVFPRSTWMTFAVRG